MNIKKAFALAVAAVAVASFVVVVYPHSASALPPVEGIDPLPEAEVIEELENQGEYPDYASGEVRRVTRHFLDCVNSQGGSPSSRIRTCVEYHGASGDPIWES